MAKEKKPKALKKKILDTFSKVVIKQCSICGSFISQKEWKEGEGVCLKHWEQ